MKKALILENIRSAYNVGNIIRTADALGYDVILAGYSPSPFENPKVVKSSLWAEKSVNIKTFYNPVEALSYAKKEYWYLVWAEITDDAIDIDEWKKLIENQNWFAVVFWNEVDWVTLETLEKLDKVFFIPMKWTKESLNVCEAAAIFMYALQSC